MMVSSLVFIIALLSVIQCGGRKTVALIFALLTLQHELLFRGVGGFSYFFSASLTDLFIMWAIVKYKDETKLVEHLLVISSGFIFLHTVSWLMWEYRLPYEVAYESMSAVLYLCVIISLINWDKAENGNYKIDRWANCFRMHNYTSFFSHNKLQGKG